jgi:hypothetical protein
LRVQTLNMKLKRYAELNRPIVIQTTSTMSSSTVTGSSRSS